MLNELLRTARTSAGISQRAVAELLGIDRPTYNKIEQNKIAPKYEDLPKLAKLLNLDLKILQKSMCAHLKTECAHPTKPKSSTSVYKFSVRLRRNDFLKLTKNNLQKCGYHSLNDFMKMAYEQFCNQLAIIELNENKK